MALYAFDGTMNENEQDNDKDTNVRKFYDAFVAVAKRKGSIYIEGPGTRHGVAGIVFGAPFGAGAKERVDEAYGRLKKNFNDGDKIIDIVGFSRGAAIALDFANTIADKARKGEDAPPIRFLGLWDTVASFGAPGNDVNIGFKLDVPRNVEHCCHALALDETRRTFDPERLTKNARQAAAQGRILEVWFRGVHSDVGGGFKEQGLSSIALCWMFAQAQRAGLEFDPAQIRKHERLQDKAGKIHEPRDVKERLIQFFKDPLSDKRRKPRKDDLVHAQVIKPPKGFARIDDAGNVTV